MTGQRRTDRRYSSRRWTDRVRPFVLRRDLGICRIVEGCTAPATVVDHIRPVYPGMSDAEFFDPRNLRAGCRDHNLGRAFAPELDHIDRRHVGPRAAVTGDFS